MRRTVIIAFGSIFLIVAMALLFPRLRLKPASSSPRQEPNASTSMPPVPFAQSTRAADSQTEARKRPWSLEDLNRFANASVGSPTRFELVSGEFASGEIDHLEFAAGNVISVSGHLFEPEHGRFFFRKQSVAGVAGDFVGLVEFSQNAKAYRVEPTGPGGSSELVERPLGHVVCLQLPLPSIPASGRKEESPPLNPAEFPSLPIPNYQNGVVVLESLHGAKGVIYLDFQGGSTTTWDGIIYARSTYTNAEIRDIWQRVAEDFMPFSINVTTDVQVFQNAPMASRQRVIVTPTDTAAPGAGGVAYVGSFNWSEETPCWAFITNGSKYCAQACSHEAGHTLGLIHDGQQVNGLHVEYYYGHGEGDTGWAPLMGVAYDQNVTQWSKGEYIDANNPQPQLAIIASQNNVQFRPDDTGDTLATSRWLELYADYTAGAQGVIESTGDTDAFRFATSGGNIYLRADPEGIGPNLAIQASLCDSNDTVLAITNPQVTLWAAINTNLPAGTYTFRVTGAGRNDPVYTGFSAYASLGYYSVTGSVANARLPDRFTVAEHIPNGTVVGTVLPLGTNQDPISYFIISGNDSGTFSIGSDGVLKVANDNLLDYNILASKTQLPVQFELLVDLLDSVNPQLSEHGRRVVVAVTKVNTPPSILGFGSTGSSFLGPGGSFPGQGSGSNFVACFSPECHLAASVVEHSPPGTPVGTVIAMDPDLYTVLSFSIQDGDSNGWFQIDPLSGTIAVAGDLSVAEQNLYNLRVVVSDQTPPVPLMATSVVSVSVVLPYPWGGIACAVYTNIPGTLVENLTNASSFPYDPAWISSFSSFAAAGGGSGGFSFNSVGNLGEDTNYGAVLRGYLLPPTNGDYTFWIASEADSELWLSSSTNPAAVSRIAYVNVSSNWPGVQEWTGYPSQQSEPVHLSLGSAYYIEARLKAGAGTNHIEAAWECSGMPREVIGSEFLSPYQMNYVPHPLGFSATLHQDALTGAYVGNVSVADLNKNNPTLVLTSGNEEGLFAFDPVTRVIRVASQELLQNDRQTNYTLHFIATDNGVPPLSGETDVTICIVPTNAVTATTISLEIWTNLPPGSDLGNLTNQSGFPTRPDLLQPLANFSSDFEALSSPWGSRLRAILTPTNSGSYTFFVAANGVSQLRLGSPADPDHAVEIAASSHPVSPSFVIPFDWTPYSSPPSAPTPLVAGQQYYLEAREVGAGASLGGLSTFGFIAAAWAGPGLSGTNIISRAFLSPLDLEYAPLLLPKTVQLPITSANGQYVTTLNGTDSVLDSLVYRLVSGNVSNTFALDPISGKLTVADNSLFAAHDVSLFKLLLQAQDSGYSGRFPLKSSQALVQVQIVDDSPWFTWSGAADNDNWSSQANWHGGLPSDASKLSFAGTSRQTNHNDFLLRASQVTLNNGGFFVSGNPLTLLAGLSSSGDNVWAIDSSLGAPQSFSASLGTLIISAAINNQGNLLSALVTSKMRFDGPLSGAGGLSVSGPGSLVLSAANTFTGPTLVKSAVLVLSNSSALISNSSVELNSGGTLDVRGCAEPFIVPPGQTLKGSGTILGPVQVDGILLSTNGVMAFKSGLALAGSTIINLAGSLLINTDSAVSNTISVSGGLVYGGVLTVVANTKTSPLRPGNSFKLFTSSSFSGSFSGLNLPPLDPGLRWDTSRLVVDGTIVVAHELPTLNPVALTNGTLVVKFATISGFHYVLEAAPSLQPPVNWLPLYSRVGTGAPTTFYLSVSSKYPAQFYRVRMY